MIYLTDKHIAVEIPENACNVQISDNGFFSYKTVINEYRSSYCITSGFNNHSLVGVTPLTEQQIHSIVGSQFNNEKHIADVSIGCIICIKYHRKTDGMIYND